jgi:hypothetical protein
MLSSDLEFMALLPKYQDLKVVVPWIDRMYKALKNPNKPENGELREIARDLGVADSGTRKKLITRIMTTSMYELLF